MVAEFGPGERVVDRVSSIVFDALQCNGRFGCGEKPLLFGLVGKIQDDEPGRDSNNTGNDPFYDEDPSPAFPGRQLII